MESPIRHFRWTLEESGTVLLLYQVNSLAFPELVYKSLDLTVFSLKDDSAK